MLHMWVSALGFPRFVGRSTDRTGSQKVLTSILLANKLALLETRPGLREWQAGRIKAGIYPEV